MVTQYITTKPIMNLSLEIEQRPIERVSERWREQGCLDMVGAWAAAAREAYSKEEEEDGSETGGVMGH